MSNQLLVIGTWVERIFKWSSFVFFRCEDDREPFLGLYFSYRLLGERRPEARSLGGRPSDPFHGQGEMRYQDKCLRT